MTDEDSSQDRHISFNLAIIANDNGSRELQTFMGFSRFNPRFVFSHNDVDIRLNHEVILNGNQATVQDSEAVRDFGQICFFFFFFLYDKFDSLKVDVESITYTDIATVIHE